MITRKTVFVLSALSFFAVASTAFAQGFTPLAPIPGLTDNVTSIISSGSFEDFFNNLYKYCVGLAATLAVVMIIWGGLEISTQDSVSKQGAGRERITQAVLGLILVLSPVLVFSIINPRILNLSLALPKLDTVTGAPVPTNATQTTTLSSTDLQLREQTGTVFDTFTVNSSYTVLQRIQTLDAKQIECNSLSSGTGVILPNSPMGGGSIQYVCQSCPQNTTVTLFPPGTNNLGSSARGARGGCMPN